MTEVKLPLYNIADHTVDLNKIRLVGPVYREGATNCYCINVDNDRIYLSDRIDFLEDTIRFRENSLLLREGLITAWCALITKPIINPNYEERRLDPIL